MADEKRILVVDDHFRILDSIKSLLESSDEKYEVIGVPSAEEGILEIRRKPVELLITDVYLPGMSGGELIVRANNLWPDLPIIVITGHAEKMGREEAAKSGIVHYFRKPLETDAFLEAVHSVMEQSDRAKSEKSHDRRVEPPTKKIDSIMQRLLIAAEASEVFLCSIDGELVYRGSEQDTLLTGISGTLTEVVSGILHLSEQMGSSNPLTYHYIADRKYELFFATAGADIYIGVYFDHLARSKTLEAIWNSLQMAIDQYVRFRDEDSLNDSSMETPYTESEIEIDTRDVLPAPEEEDGKVDEDSDEETAALMPDSLELPAFDETVDLDAFWEDALAVELDREGGASGLNIDEARKIGAVPPEFDPDESA